ncbi:MAG: thioredoxin-disulfide reductase [Eubacteriales bacterium]
MIYDMMIIGAGPAGLTAGIYAARAGLKAVVFEKQFAGGQMTKTDLIENYPGIVSVTGVDFSMQMQAHAVEAGADIQTVDIDKLELSGKVKKVFSGEEVFEGKTVVLAMGAQPRKLNLESELKLAGRGVSYCATCDGAFFRGKDVAVIGGGDTAAEDALYLSKIASRVFMVHRRDALRAEQYLGERIEKTDNIEMVWDSTLDQITGENVVDGIDVVNKNTGETRHIPVSGTFIAVGVVPESALVKDQVKIDDQGYVVADETCETDVPGVFVAGDLRGKKLRQIVTATADGAVAVAAVEEYLNRQG